MLFPGQQLHQSVFPELAVQMESQPDQYGCGYYAESNAEPLVHAGHIKNDKQHCLLYTSDAADDLTRRLESLELRTLADSLVQFIIHIHYYI